jgi:hypothetical protein
MGNELTDKQIDKIMFRYFDGRFKNSFYGEEKVEFGDMWAGIFDGDDNMLIGTPLEGDRELWFSHCPIFGYANDILDISHSELNQSMIRYLNKKYPEVKIGRIV